MPPINTGPPTQKIKIEIESGWKNGYQAGIYILVLHFNLTAFTVSHLVTPK